MTTNTHLSITFSSTFLRIKNISGKGCRENRLYAQYARAVYEIMWNNTAERDKSQMTIWRRRIACWIPKATNTDSEYVIFIAFPLQQWLHERASILCYTYTAGSLILLNLSAKLIV
jgi:hypothetical protein